MGTTRPSPDARSALVDCATTILDSAQSAGVVPAGACLIVAVGDADTAVVLANGNALTAIHRQTGN